ncbi:class I SAM-dependent DNA methyltransferase [Adlercreutzia sp. ZJ138]|uniref:class I SAM-dependent DNA methyltransferase n=1 Tax=Adlercreutzia sp. ZJ138 TaxID=2709405 RepID=UPI0013ED71AC|nr:class I SAM-dependent DNA methyltransferase [Adlercreutzia sp. ZJ138]
MLIVRLVFLLYAEDAGLFNGHQAFYKYMKGFNAEQSRVALLDLFTVLDTPEDKRDPYASEKLLEFPYVNGSLFADETIIVPQFTEDLRVELLLNASCGFNWKDISPTIFGAVFESTLNPETRRAGGMHYTFIENIHKVIDPLFLDDLKAELAEIEGEKVERKRMFALRAFQQKLASLNIFDPACGSGNFLTESYIQLRRLENRVLESIQGDQVAMGFDGEADPVKVSIRQFYGIEINDFAVSVAKTALWIAESQMLTETQDIVSRYIDYFPLTTNAYIVEGNALRMDWNDVLPAEKCSYIIGNPPFYGASMCSGDQKQEIVDLYGKIKLSNSLDYVSGWYYKAAEMMVRNETISAAFVSTNSICQGEQVFPIWNTLIERFGIYIDFAWTTFIWDSEATSKAHVHCVIIGFSVSETRLKEKRLFDPTTGQSIICENVSPYLRNAPTVLVASSAKPIESGHPVMKNGSKPTDGGWYLFTPDEMKEFIMREPASEAFFRPWVGSEEFIKGKERWCLYLGDVKPSEIEGMPCVRERVDAVRKVRLGEGPNSKGKMASKKPPAPTIKSAETPMRFFCDNVQDEPYLIIPAVSSERRRYIPIGFMEPRVIASNLVATAEHASLYDFGVLTSQFHNAWMRAVAGRLKSDYRYTPGLVYNTYVWPATAPEQKPVIEQAAQAVLDARAAHPGWSLAQLYDPDKMPADLLKAHKTLDAAVEAAYGVDFEGDEEKIVAHLFKLYAEATATSK